MQNNNTENYLRRPIRFILIKARLAATRTKLAETSSGKEMER